MNHRINILMLFITQSRILLSLKLVLYHGLLYNSLYRLIINIGINSVKAYSVTNYKLLSSMNKS